MTPVANCITILALMYGMIVKEKIAQFSKAPPLNKLNSPITLP